MSLKRGALWRKISGYIESLGDVNIAFNDKLAWGDNDTYIHEHSDDHLAFVSADVRVLNVRGVDVYGGNASGATWGLMNELPTTTTPNILPNRNDDNTGLGGTSSDGLSIIAGGVEGIRVHETGGVILTRIQGIQNHVDNATAIGTGGLAVGDVYRNGDVLQIVH